MDQDSDHDPAKTLISPPPEDTLRRFSTTRNPTSIFADTSKRKRIPAATVEVTPNPKPRKQTRRQSTASPTRRPSVSPSKRKLIQSPHATNPDADFLPPALARLRARHRSSTPIPPYEAPTEQFTPPREVFVTPLALPSQSKSSKRKSVSTKRKPLRVKTEMPDVDLSLPIPLGSPTDDPLLLSAPPPSVRRRSASHRPSVNLRDTPDIPSTSPIRPSSTPVYFDWALNHQDSTDEPGASMPLFDLANLPDLNGGWSDSDDDSEVFDGSGEYTGKFRVVHVPTKADPPTSGTRGRMDRWGRPISPFPAAKKPIGRGQRVFDPGMFDQSDQPDDPLPQEESNIMDVAVQRDGDFSNPSMQEEEVPLQDTRSENGSLDEAFHFMNEDARPSELDFFANAEGLGKHHDEEQSFEDPSLDHVMGESPEEIPPPDQEPDSSLQHLDELNGKGLPPVDEAPQSVELDASFNVSIEEEVPPLSRRSLFGRQVAMQEEEEEEQLVDRELSREPDSDEEEEPPAQKLEPELESHEVERHLGADVASIQTTVEQLPPSEHAAQTETDHSYRTPWHTKSTHSQVRRASPAVSSPGFDEHMRVETEVQDDSSDDEPDSDVDVGVVRISSDDPRAAARAAAILKQHDYDCFTKIILKPRRSHVSVDEFTRSARRRSATEGGVRKAGRRRATVGGVIGEHVFIPGTPMMTLPELLLEAETRLESRSVTPGGGREPFRTPALLRHSVPRTATPGSAREWTREDWKNLDGCFTDARVAAGGAMGEREDVLADVDDVRIEDVVDRFVDLMGGQDAVNEFGGVWDRDNLLMRARALQSKQRSGNVAPPSTPSTPASAFGMLKRRPSMEVPDFTPLGRRAPPPRTLRKPIPVTLSLETPFKDISRDKTKLPPSLLAPQYSHLLEEAVAISQTSSNGVSMPVTSNLPAYPAIPPAEQERAPPRTVPVLPSLSIRKVKSFLCSYIPAMPKTAPAARTAKPHRPARPGLPLPPPELLEKPRGPIATPVHVPAPRPPHPKEQVRLNHAPLPPPRPTRIPRAPKPQRMVELHPLSPPPLPPPTREERGRRSSGGSVKDLVRGFEEMEGMARKMEPKRVKNIGDWKAKGPIAGRPTWRP